MTRFSLMRSIKRFGGLMLLLSLPMNASAVVAQTPMADGQVIKIDSAAIQMIDLPQQLRQFGDVGGDAAGPRPHLPTSAGPRHLCVAGSW
jgi:hypothetical protein